MTAAARLRALLFQLCHGARSLGAQLPRAATSGLVRRLGLLAPFGLGNRRERDRADLAARTAVLVASSGRVTC